MMKFALICIIGYERTDLLKQTKVDSFPIPSIATNLGKAFGLGRLIILLKWFPSLVKKLPDGYGACTSMDIHHISTYG